MAAPRAMLCLHRKPLPNNRRVNQIWTDISAVPPARAMDAETAEDILKDSLNVFGEDEASHQDAGRIMYGPLEITVAPKVSFCRWRLVEWLILRRLFAGRKGSELISASFIRSI